MTMPKLAASAGVVAVLAALTSGCGGASTADQAPGASASPTQARPLLAIEGHAQPRLVRLDRDTLRPLGRPVRLGRTAWGQAVSPDGRRLAVGGRSWDDLRVVDTQAMRARRVSLSPRPYGGVEPVAWLSESRLLAIASPHPSGTVYAVDVDAGRIVAERQVDGQIAGHAAADGRAVLLTIPRAEIGAASLAVADAAGRLRTVRLARVAAGEIVEDSSPYHARRVAPGLAVDPRRGRAYVLGAGALVAEVDLDTLAVSYHELAAPVSLLERVRAWLEPEAQAKVIVGPSRQATWLGDGLIAVSGVDRSARGSGDEPEARAEPAGLKIVDTARWSVRTIDPDTSIFRAAGGLLLASGYTWESPVGATDGSGLRAYEPDGTLVYEVFAGEVVHWFDVAGSRLYVPRGDAPDERTAVVDLAGGRVLRVLDRPPPLLVPGDGP